MYLKSPIIRCLTFGLICWLLNIFVLPITWSAPTTEESLPDGVDVKENWAHFLGPSYNGVPLVEHFAPKDIKQVWSRMVYPGCSSVTIVDGKLYTMGNHQESDIVFCLDVTTGETIWKFEYDSELMANNYEGGPNSTPTVADGRVFTLSRKGRIFCLDAQTGEKVWEASAEKWSPKGAWWGFSDSALVWGDKVFFNIGSRGLALRRDTGQIVWSSEQSIASYSTLLPLPASKGILNQPALVVQSCSSLDIVESETGKSFMGDTPQWAQRRSNCNAVTPAVYKGSLLFMHSGHGLSKVSKQGELWVEDWLCEELVYDKWDWFTFNRQVIRDGYLFALAGSRTERSDRLVCVNLDTGEVEWEKPSPFGNLTLAADKLIIVTQNGEIAWGSLDGNQYMETFRRKLLQGGRGREADGPYWAHPVLHDGYLYTRSNKGKLTCFRFE